MKKLFLMRHAKSSWVNADLADFYRPLNERGQKAAPFMGELMRKNQILPDLIISSPARRAKQTAIFVKESAQIKQEIQFDERIYEASPHKLLYILSEVADKLESVLIVGHNPGMEGLLKILTGEIQSMPTAALAIIELDINSWSEIKADSGKLIKLIRPKDEMQSFAAD